MVQAALLKNIYLFKGLSDADVAKVAEIATEKRFSAGQDVFVFGQEAQSFFVIGMGSLRIYSTTKEGDEIELSNLSTGDHFGEVSFLDSEKRSATVQAVETSTLFEIKFEDFKKLLESDQGMSIHVYKAMSKYLCGRLRTTSEDLSHLREIRLRHT